MGVTEKPLPPIHMRWGGRIESFESLRVLGQNLEFVIEREIIDAGEPYPDFRDAAGQRFRILVISLEIVLCIAVPPNFDPRQLELAEVRDGEETMVIEHLRGDAHRALRIHGRGHRPTVTASEDDLERFAADDLRDGAIPPAAISWSIFDELWCGAVDPSPAIGLGTALRGLVSRILRGDRRR